MVKGVLLVAGDRRPALAAHEVLALERAEQLLGLGPGKAACRCHGADPEDLPVHGGLLQELLLPGRQRIEASRDHALHRFGQLPRGPPFAEHPNVLLREERVPARTLQELTLILRELHRLVEKPPDETRGVVLVQRLQ